MTPEIPTEDTVLAHSVISHICGNPPWLELKGTLTPDLFYNIQNLLNVLTAHKDIFTLEIYIFLCLGN